MELKTKISVIARCVMYSNDNEDTTYKEDIELYLSKEQAANILFKIYPDHFMIDDFKVSVIIHNNEFVGITMKKDSDRYIIKNISQFIADVHEGYFRLLAIEKFTNILENANNITFDDIKDEFDES